MTDRVAGVDGCRSGWLRVERDAKDHLAGRVFSSADKLLADSSAFRVLAIDMPIGLTDEGPRECDIAARRLVRKRYRSVFRAPVRSGLEATDFRDACSRSLQADGNALSQQAWAIVPHIREIDRLLREIPAFRDTVREVHPEVSFTYCNGGKPMEREKTSGFGFIERLELLQTHFGDSFRRLRGEVSTRDAADDDLLDAAVALWTAERIRDGSAVRLPATTPFDRLGLPMVIFA